MLLRPNSEKTENGKNAKKLFLQGVEFKNISAQTEIPESTLRNWAKTENWESELPVMIDPVEFKLARRLNALIDKEGKTKDELDELTVLVKSFGNLSLDLAKAAKLKAEALAISKGNINIAPEDATLSTYRERKSGNKRKEKEVKNDISAITAEQIDKILTEPFTYEGETTQFFAYQLKWWENRWRRIRFILKSRQIGATWYFALEALLDAILTGRNKLFISASRAQSEIFKAYINSFAKIFFGIELKSSDGFIELSNGAQLRFLSTNSKTGQGFRGDLYIDECFWINRFKEVFKTASGMAAHKKWRITLFSTPSVTSHQAYSKWSGKDYNEGKNEKRKVHFDISHEALKEGVLGADNIWRQIVTVKDAEEAGCNLFDINSLKLEYSSLDWGNLFLCLFIDDALSIFTLKQLERCMFKADAWDDYDEFSSRPFGNRPVALGYDPSRTRDSAVLVIMAIPLSHTEKWRVLKTYNFKGQNFKYQATRIKEIVQSHNVQHIGIDSTGIGLGVFEEVLAFYPMATPYNYSVDVKTRLVVKLIDVVDNNRIEWLEGDIEITQSLLMMNKTCSSAGMITYGANRNVDVGHADYGFSVCHALGYESLTEAPKTQVY